MKSLLALIMSGFLFSTCKKSDTPTLYMSGHIYNNCYDLEPMRNSGIRLFRTNSGSLQQGKVVASGSTDSTGYFKIYFPKSEDDNWMKLQGSGGGDILEGILPTENIEDIDVFGRIYANIKVSLNVINPHNVGDTLFIEKLDDFTNFLKIPCPLSSGTIYSIAGYTPVNPTGYNGTKDQIIHKFSSSPSLVKFSDFLIYKYCQDTVFVTVNIN